jgi:preprotein translocase subunit Sss1
LAGIASLRDVLELRRKFWRRARSPTKKEK